MALSESTTARRVAPDSTAAAAGSVAVMTDDEIIHRLEDDCRDAEAWSALVQRRLPAIADQKIRGESDLRRRVVSRAAAKIFVRFRNREDRGESQCIDHATAYLCTCVVSALVEVLRTKPTAQPPDATSPRTPERPQSPAERERIRRALNAVSDEALEAVRAQGRNNHAIATALLQSAELDRTFPPFQGVCLQLGWTDPGQTKVYRERWRRFLKVYFQQVVQRSGLDTEDVIAALVPRPELEESWLIS